jgi:diguanylate cyclase (GGDEF)-like protein
MLSAFWATTFVNTVRTRALSDSLDGCFRVRSDTLFCLWHPPFFLPFVDTVEEQVLAELRATLPPGVASSEHWKPRLSLSYVGRQAGLPSGQTHIAVEGQDRRIWIAGPCGLAAYDGKRVVAIGAKEGLSTHGLRTLASDYRCRLWIGSDAGVDYLDTDGTVKRVAGRRRWTNGPADHISVTRDDTVFVGTSTGLVVAKAGEDFSPTGITSLDQSVITSIAQSVTGEVFVSNSLNEIWLYANQHWQLVPRRVYTGVGAIEGIATTDDDRLIVFGLSGVGIVTRNARLAGTPVTMITIEPSHAVLWSDGVLWRAHGRELKVHREVSGTWELSAQADIRSSINQITTDQIGNIWCATDALGCCKVSGLWRTIVQPDLGDAGQAYALRRGRGGAMLIGTENGVYKMHSQDRKPQRMAALAGKRVWDVLDHGDGTVWAATHFDGLLRIHPNESVERGPRHPVLDAPCRTLARFDEALFVGTLGGLVAIRGNNVEELTGDGGASLGYVYTLVVDRDWLWIGTLGNGLWKYSASVGMQQVRGPGLSVSGNTYAIAFREDFTRLVVQDNRFILLDRNHRATRLHEADTSVAGWCAIFRNSTTLAVGDSEGLAEYEFPSMQLKRRVRCGGIGLDGWEFISSRALSIDSAGRYWCGLNSGLTIVDHERLSRFSEAPTTRLLATNWTNAEAVREGTRFRVTAGKWIVQLQCYSSWLVDETDVRYRYKLVGFDDHWSPLTSESQISFSSLPEGTYLLEAQAHSSLTGFGPVCLLAQIDVHADGWGAVGLGRVIGAIAQVSKPFSSRMRNSQLLALNKELASRVEERTADLARANRQLLESNQQLEGLLRLDPLTGITNRRGLDEAVTREWKRASREATPLAVVMVDIDYFKRLNDNQGHAYGDTCLRLVAQCLAATVRNEVDTCARFGGEEFAVVAPGSTGPEAMVLANRLCAAVSNLQLTHPHSPISAFLTVSAGVASIIPSGDESPESLFKRGDSALYVAKRRGRNQVWLHSDDPSLDEGA